jgi:Cu2+-exporting ATPase
VSAAAEAGLLLEGLRCAGCAHRVEEALRGAAGVREATVNYTNHRALVEFDPQETDSDHLVDEVRSLGFDAVPYDPSALDRPADRSARAALTRLLVAAFLAGNVMWLAVALYIGARQGMDSDVRAALRWCIVALSLPAATWCALPFWQGAWSGLRRWRLSIDVPIVIGISMSLGTTIAGTWAEVDHLYVDSAAMIVFLILLGRTLERRARARASSAVDRLAALTPREARRRGASGALESVPVEALVRGDVVHVGAGERVPCDLFVEDHPAELDESIVTGESTPVVREVGDAIPAGAIVVAVDLHGRVAAPANEGTVARMSELLERAQASRPPIQHLADRVASVFAPTVLLVALAAGLWGVLSGLPGLEIAMRTAAVLIVACPCALGLATPAAITAAVGRAAQLGILVKSGAALERLAETRALLLDKTGTLTEGRFRVARVQAAPGIETREVLVWAARAEGASSHPLAEALRDAAPEAGPPLEPVTAHPGLGVIAGEKEPVVVGRARLLEEAGVGIPKELEDQAGPWRDRGYAIVWVARTAVLGWIALWDEPRDDARLAVQALERAGVDVHLITGDHAVAARLAADEVGIERVEAGVTPEAKLSWIEGQRRAGYVTTAVGDGLNDAAALGAADVGVAMARGSDVTLHAADLVIRSPRLTAVPEALGLARATLGRIRENLGFAVAYNAVAVPLAIGGVLGPLEAAIAMSASSLIVTANALRLLRWRLA